MNLTIKKANLSDSHAILDIAKKTFIDTYYRFNDPKNIDSYIQQHFNLSQIEKELVDDINYFFLAYLDHQLVGYTKLRKTTPSQLAEFKVLEIERIYVDGAFKGKKIGGALMQQAIAMGQGLGYEYIWLGVWSENPQAIAFYEHQGFEVFGNHVFMMGEEAQEDFLMRKKISDS